MSMIAKISARAKAIRRKKPGVKWQTAIKQASRELKGSKVGAVKKKAGNKKSTNRQTGRSSAVHDARFKAKAPGKRKSAGGKVYYERRKNRSDKPGTVTGVSRSALAEISRLVTLNQYYTNVLERHRAFAKEAKGANKTALLRDARKYGDMIRANKKLISALKRSI